MGLASKIQSVQNRVKSRLTTDPDYDADADDEVDADWNNWDAQLAAFHPVVDPPIVPIDEALSTE